MHEATQDMTLEQVLGQMNLSDEEKTYVYMTIIEAVAKRMDNMLAKILSEENMQHIEACKSEEEANTYIAGIFEEKTGRRAQEVSDELMRVMINAIKKEGISALLKERS